MNLTIEKLVYGGDGLSRLPEGKTVFTPFVLPAEEVSATIVQEKSSFARATVDQIIKPSPYRIAPPCPYFGTCGGCHYQHAGYTAQLENKRAILKETLLRNGKLEWKGEIITHSGEPWGYRNRSRLKVRTAPDFAIGYYKMGTNELLPVKQCPISSAAINRVLTHVWEMGEAGKVPAGVNEIEFFADHADAKMVLEIYLAPDAPEMREFAAALQAKAPEIKGIAFFTENPDAAEPVAKIFRRRDRIAVSGGRESLSRERRIVLPGQPLHGERAGADRSGRFPRKDRAGPFCGRRVIRRSPVKALRPGVRCGISSRFCR